MIGYWEHTGDKYATKLFIVDGQTRGQVSFDIGLWWVIIHERVPGRGLFYTGTVKQYETSTDAMNRLEHELRERGIQ